MQIKSRDSSKNITKEKPQGTSLILSQTYIRPQQLNESASFVETQELIANNIGDTNDMKKRLFQKSMKGVREV